MITYKPIIIPGGRRKDGTWPVKIRVTFKGVARRLPTTLTCADQDLTRSGKIKNATILEKANELISRMRATTDTLSPFTLEAWDVDQVIDYIRTTLTSQSFRLDFIAFGREFILGKAPGTRAGYTTALNAFARFLGKEAIDVNAITRTLLVQFQEWADQQGRIFYNYRKGTYQETGKATAPGGNAGRWVSRLGHIYQAAKDRYNDEDAGRIPIPRSPFDSVPRKRAQPQGQRALPVEVIQRVIDARPEVPQERIALAAFVASFGLMGANLADLYDGIPINGPYWRYNRRKTAGRRMGPGGGNSGRRAGNRGLTGRSPGESRTALVEVLQDSGYPGEQIPALLGGTGGPGTLHLLRGPAHLSNPGQAAGSGKGNH